MKEALQVSERHRPGSRGWQQVSKINQQSDILLVCCGMVLSIKRGKGTLKAKRAPAKAPHIANQITEPTSEIQLRTLRGLFSFCQPSAIVRDECSHISI
jgi:hypothetical protein